MMIWYVSTWYVESILITNRENARWDVLASWSTNCKENSKDEQDQIPIALTRAKPTIGTSNREDYMYEAEYRMSNETVMI